MFYVTTLYGSHCHVYLPSVNTKQVGPSWPWTAPDLNFSCLNNMTKIVDYENDSVHGNVQDDLFNLNSL